MQYSIIQKSQLEGANRLDAEYYQPEYLQLINNLEKTKAYKPWSEIDSKFITGPFGSEFNVENYVEDTDYRYVRGKDVKEFFLLDDDNVYIPSGDFERLKKYSLQKGDILISVVGTLGNTSVVDESATPAIFSCKSTVFRTNTIDPFYLIAYLNCKYGKSLLQRSVRGHVQTGLNIDDLKSLLIFVPSQQQQDKIAPLVIEARQSLEDSKLFYSQAENLLLEELGLGDFKPEESLSYVVHFRETQEANRVDAEYFDPKYEKVEKILSKFKQQRLEDLSSLISYGTVPTSPYVKEGGITYVKGEDIQNCFIDYSKLVYLEKESTKKLPQKVYLKANDIVISQMGTVGRAALATKAEEGWLFASFTIRARLTNEAIKILDPLYLTLFINNVSRPYYLLRRIAQASVRQNTDLPTIRDLRVPILPKSTQQKIADLVRKSHEARKKSKALLKEAKRKVEEMIEKGVKNG
ncbi:hypothetical protein A3B52_02110 [Candidatus Curtissbacteria bacterium RIFCSPLOWO2_01_FULL_41_28]|uniref:Type I restriction modification DNA specificity domain-containing protein n=1 Tax=Candidatus Curtissbacteria bacterium RIFOXYA1_FULL_41_14 TaxID=1797737 RepID=A0A1F5HEE2_9BACT|nr:MAG: Type I restriction modification system, N-6 DNA Methylase [Candidatus Curtissbacteria bacterium GW2011_GWB1_40_28]KKR60401.1 MAG: Type I restriction modification system, N-6 DNA Methylase [Candidatus Curtissbacteria bacterium GW2011_GWA2_40_31]KKR60992.1 MAG: hypothetical protein UU00_C0023G0004 [Microgenomates group bacterium GW2011_GWC1_40_35]KKS02013.1 MAG: Type I restriction modification system, N-6 DNA Methylase [Candidatus Curtissbacteria bacterium GW2011_GWC2_41_21]OGD79686.1 MAG